MINLSSVNAERGAVPDGYSSFDISQVKEWTLTFSLVPPFNGFPDEVRIINGNSGAVTIGVGEYDLFVEGSYTESRDTGDFIYKLSGGGICDNAPALNILRPLGIFVYLDIDEKSACDRILKKAEKLSDGTWKNLPAYIARQNPAEETEIRKIFHAFYEERSKTYRDIADIIAPTSEESKEENTKKILLALES